jgi:hypothetical protein
MNRIGSSMQNKNSISLVKSQQLSIKITKNLNNFYFHKKISKKLIIPQNGFPSGKTKKCIQSLNFLITVKKISYTNIPESFYKMSAYENK